MPKVVLQRMWAKNKIPKPNKTQLKPDNGKMKPDGTLTYLKDDWVRAIGIPGFGLSIPTLTGLFGNYTFQDPQVWFGYLYFIFLAFVIWQGNRYLLFTQRARFSWFSKPWVKVFLMVFANVCYTLPVTVFMLLFYYKYSGLPATDWNAILTVSLTNVICVLFVTHVYETVFLIKERESDLLTLEKLERTKAQAELEALKSQIDPHFMFNSLNTLAYLIDNDQKKAAAFNNKLADVYRYILTNKDRKMVFLEEELHFLNDYFDLFKIRFAAALQMKIQVDETVAKAKLIPPISLQILLENVVKHNSFSRQKPMLVELKVNQDFLIFSNKLSPKTGVLKSGIGLANLSERYELIVGKKPEFDSEVDFVVKLPLLNS